MMAYCPAISDEGLKRQVRQVTRWLFAARQDLNPGVKFLHASYGVGNLDIIRQVALDSDIRRVTGYDPVKLLKDLEVLQDEAQRALGF